MHRILADSVGSPPSVATHFRGIAVLADGVRFATSDHEDAVIFWALRGKKVRDELLRRGWRPNLVGGR